MRLLLFTVSFFTSLTLLYSNIACKTLAVVSSGKPRRLWDYRNITMNWSDANDFQLTKRIGRGSFGEVYLGQDIRANVTCIIKIYRFGKLSKSKMMREILVTQSLCGGSNIVRLIHLIQENIAKNPALVMEYAKNTYYRELYPTLTAEDVRLYSYELLKGIAYAHGKGVMHRDIKPNNVMIDHSSKTLKIIDWGLAKFYYKEDDQNVAGSTYYKAPEVLMGYPKYGYGADMWSFGCMFAGWLFQKIIYFRGNRVHGQLHEIAKIMGSDELIEYSKKYNMSFNVSSVRSVLPRVSWESQVSDINNNSFATADAIDLLDHLLVYDHNRRISAQDALAHPYFLPLRKAEKQATTTTTAVATTTQEQQPQAKMNIQFTIKV